VLAHPERSADVPVRALALGHPSAVRVLEDLGLDPCCEGDRTLEAACKARGISAGRALAALERAEEETAPARRTKRPSLLQRLEALIADHRDLVAMAERSERLAKLMARAHGALEPALAGVVRDVEALHERLLEHAAEEDAVLLPGGPPARGGPVAAAALEAARGRLAEVAGELEAVEAGFAAAPHACPSARDLRRELRELEQAVAQHLEQERAVAALLAARVTGPS
jgi:regulator of cell morphogenesis and NO signaling